MSLAEACSCVEACWLVAFLGVLGWLLVILMALVAWSRPDA